MGNTSSGAVAPTKKRALPLVIVLVMAVLAGLVMLYATVANGYEDSSYSPMQKPVSVEKQLEPGTEPSGDTLFEYELIVSPQYANDRHNQIDKGSSAVTSVTGTVYDVTYDADGKATLALAQAVKGESDKYFINGMAAATEWDGIPTPGKVNVAIQDHKVNFSLKAGQRIVFENMPFAHKDADCGFVVNELIGDDSAAAQAGYGFSKVLVTDGAQYETTDKAYTDVVTNTGTLAKALYDSYKEYLYTYHDADGNEVDAEDAYSSKPVYVYYDADDNVVTNPNVRADERVYVYFNRDANADTANWYFYYWDSNKGNVWYDRAGNIVEDPQNKWNTGNSGYYGVENGKVITPNWAEYEQAYVNHATEVLPQQDDALLQVAGHCQGP